MCAADTVTSVYAVHAHACETVTVLLDLHPEPQDFLQMYDLTLFVNGISWIEALSRGRRHRSKRERLHSFRDHRIPLKCH